jgi:hypothetical protein
MHVKTLQAYHDRDKALFQARMEKEGLSLQIELAELRAELSTALVDAESKLAAAFKMQRDEKDKLELQISSFLQDIESARAEALAQSLSARVSYCCEGTEEITLSYPVWLDHHVCAIYSG